MTSNFTVFCPRARSLRRSTLGAMSCLSLFAPSGAFAQNASGGVAGGVAGGAADTTPRNSVPMTAAQTAKQNFESNYLLGDWGGARTALWELGIDPQFLLITDPYGNPTGGKKQGFATYSMFCADLGIDTERAFALPGGEFDVGFSVNFGSQLTQDYVGNVFPIQSSDVAPEGARLTNLSYTQAFFGEKLSIRGGRFSLDALYGEEFAGSEYFRAFTSVAFNAIPFAIFYNAPGPFGYPATTWGARVKVEPTDDWYVMGAVYDGNPDAALADEHGLDFSFEGPPLGVGEIGLRFNQKEGDTGLPGNLKFGGFVLGGEVEEFGSTEEGSGRYGFYVVGDQMLVRLGGPSENRHLGIFGSVVVAPDQEVSPMPYFFSGGLVAYGPFESRPKDFLALGVAYGAFSDDLRAAQQAAQLTDPTVEAQLFEMTLEASYGVQVRPGLMLQPGMQLIINPGGSPDVDPALAIGVNAILSF
jgi:porin